MMSDYEMLSIVMMIIMLVMTAVGICKNGK